MARVIYTGPLNPVIFARAKKEAEKAERIKGYTPRIIKTPSHTVVYSKTGAEVKAVVMDMLAPITFSIPGSAIPVAPNFLHLHPDLPEKVYGQENKIAISNGVDRYFTLLSYPRYTPIVGFDTDFYIAQRMYALGMKDSLYEVSKSLWDTDEGQFPESSQQESSISITTTQSNSFSSSEVTGARLYSDTGGVDGFVSRKSFNASGTICGAFLRGNIRDAIHYNGYIVELISQKYVDIKNEYNDKLSIREIFDIEGTATGLFDMRALLFDTNSVAINFNGESVFSRINMEIISSTNEYYKQGRFDAVFGTSLSGSTLLEAEISTDIDNRLICKYQLQNEEYSYNTDQIVFTGNEVFRHSSPDARKSIYAIGSCELFDGVFIWCKTYDGWIYQGNNKKTKYDTSSQFVKSHLSYYFDVFKGVYFPTDAPHLKPASITTDGICLPHAWFFCRGNETRETDFYPNNHNRLSIVIYPQGRHEFSVEEAQIVSVELEHPPQYLVRPGRKFAFSLTSFTNQSGPFSYVVQGLAEELDDKGEKTGFYLAQDGAVTGEFSATSTTAEFILSPRQPTNARRLVVMSVETGRATPVSGHVEVFGRGADVIPTLAVSVECLTPEILAGQSANFYVTCTAVANNSQLLYTIKRGGIVVASGYFTVSNGASWDTWGPPVASRHVSESNPTRYVVCDASTTGTAQQNTIYEITVGPEGTQATASFTVVSASVRYANQSDRPPAIDLSSLPPMFFLQPSYMRDFGGGIMGYAAANVQHTLIQRVWYSLKSKKVYVLFWDGQSCDVSGILKQNPESGQYEYNPDWKETSFDYPPAVDPYNIKGTLEPYVYAYMDYENNRTGA